MGLTLDALRRIEAKSSRQRPSEPMLSPVDTPEETRSEGRKANRESPASVPSTAGPWVQSIEVAAETTLERLETFVTLAAETFSQTPADPSPETQAAETDTPAVAIAPRVRAADSEPVPISPLPRGEAEAPHEIPRPQPAAWDDVPYQELADNILAQLTLGRPVVLAFTSSGDGHGKTAVLTRLAPALAQRVAGGVLLLDANFRNPDLGVAFGLNSGGRLPDVLRGKTTWTEAVRPTPTSRLSLLAGGHLSEKALASESFDLESLLRDIKRHYRLVLVDVASLAHGEVAPILGCCEGTYLVEQVGRSHPRAVRQAARLIEKSHGCLLGCVAVG